MLTRLDLYPVLHDHRGNAGNQSPGNRRRKWPLVLENQTITFPRNQISSLTHLRTSGNGFDHAPYETIEVPYDKEAPQGHGVVIEAFLNAILEGTPLIAEDREGLHSLSLSNAMMLSSFTGQPVPLPMDEDAFTRELAERIRTSRFQKKHVTTAALDFDASWKVK